ncbi:MAG: DNA alkylation repair protein [Oscillospiraceae bacterium]|nr:DNA alkylation repair protein [Oscillospiraceae bacterium]
MTNFQQRLFALQDLSYRDFQAKLIPTVDPETVIGIRTPALRKLARELAKGEDVQSFLDGLPHQYYDENNLHAFLIEQCKDFDRTVALLDAFLPYVDNWATCDLCSPKVFAKHLPELLPHIMRWTASNQTYTIRFGLEMLMRYYLDGAFQPAYLELAASLRSEEYYVNMMIAWFFATALAKQYDAALPYLAERRLEAWTHNKTIQKAVESNRISPEQKGYLKTLRL